MYTMALGPTSFKTEFEMQSGDWMAASVIFTRPMFLRFFLAQRIFVDGASMTGMRAEPTRHWNGRGRDLTPAPVIYRLLLNN